MVISSVHFCGRVIEKILDAETPRAFANLSAVDVLMSTGQLFSILQSRDLEIFAFLHNSSCVIPFDTRISLMVIMSPPFFANFCGQLKYTIVCKNCQLL